MATQTLDALSRTDHQFPDAAELEDVMKDVPAHMWAAVNWDMRRVVAIGADMREARRLASVQGEQNPLVYCQPERDMILA